MSGRGSSTIVQCRERRWLSPATSVLRTLPKERVALTRQRRQFYLHVHKKVGAEQKNQNSKLMPKAMAMIQRSAQNRSSVEFSISTSQSEGHGFVS